MALGKDLQVDGPAASIIAENETIVDQGFSNEVDSDTDDGEFSQIPFKAAERRRKQNVAFDALLVANLTKLRRKMLTRILDCRSEASLSRKKISKRH